MNNKKNKDKEKDTENLTDDLYMEYVAEGGEPL